MTVQTPHYRHKLSFRYAVTLLANLLRIGIAGITGIIAARALGPDGYGTVNFLLATFSSAITLMALGSADAFYTFISAGRRGPLLFRAFFGFILLPYALLALFIAAAPAGLAAAVWRNLPAGLLLLGLSAAFLMYTLWTVMQQIGESTRETVQVQKIRIGIVLANFLAVSGLALCGSLDARLFLLTIIATHTGAIIWFCVRFKWETVIDAGRPETLPALLGQFGAYCTPIAALAAVSAMSAFGDKWFLQTFAGAAQQG
ncbi:MAG: hypothetical protein PHW69_07810, partial [Elusimicrobiaceae bacterium]|nr:hypothetical protein [Elusimicrobiaceae bacterium]